MQQQGQFQFLATPGSTFVTFIVSAVMIYIPIVGFAFAINYFSGWIADNITINGQKIKFESSFGETWIFFFVQMLLVAVTFGIYIFWYVPKAYNFILNHVSFVPANPVTQQAPVAAQTQPTQNTAVI